MGREYTFEDWLDMLITSCEVLKIKISQARINESEIWTDNVLRIIESLKINFKIRINPENPNVVELEEYVNNPQKTILLYGIKDFGKTNVERLKAVLNIESIIKQYKNKGAINLSELIRYKNKILDTRPNYKEPRLPKF